MNKDTKKYLIIGTVALVVFYGINKWLKKMPTAINDDAYAGLNMTKVLSKGSKGDEVSELQRILINQYSADLGYSGANKDGIDGEFGAMTEKALLDAKGVKQISLKQLLTNK
jgi:hypothetical protein